MNEDVDSIVRVRNDLKSIRFPIERSLGKVFTDDWANPLSWTEIGKASGKISVAQDRPIRLVIGADAIHDFSPLSQLRPDDLQVLEITCSCTFDGSQLRHLKHLTGLWGLALWETDTRDEDFAVLNVLVNLRWLDLGDTLITDETLRGVGTMPSLKHLVLLNTSIGDNGLSSLGELPSLQRLDLMGTMVGDDSIINLSRMRNLEYLRIIDTRITYPGFVRLQRVLPKCLIAYHEFARG